MLLGAIDTGKSSFAKYLIQQGLQKGYRVAHIDADMGQSTLGPPCTIGMKILHDKSDWIGGETLLHFIGATSPVGHFLTTVVGINKLVEKAKSQNANLIIIDTTGLVYGDIARELKFRKVESVNPQYLVAFQRKGEIEHLLIPHEKSGRCKIFRLPVSEKVVPRSPDDRRAYREQKFAEYFKLTKPIGISITQVAFHNTWLNSGRTLHLNEQTFLEKILGAIIVYGEIIGNTLFIITGSKYDSEELYKIESRFGISRFNINELAKLQNLIIGLNSGNNETIAIGILLDIDSRTHKLKILTPLSDLSKIKLIEFGFIRVDKSGKELGKYT